GGWPQSPESGGWDGLKRFADAVHALKYLLSIHDQYRDYYTDAPSWDPQFAIHEEDATSPPHAFPGTRFGITKEGEIPFMRHWDGGKQSFLTPSMMLGHLKKNYDELFAHGVFRTEVTWTCSDTSRPTKTSIRSIRPRALTRCGHARVATPGSACISGSSERRPPPTGSCRMSTTRLRC